MLKIWDSNKPTYYLRLVEDPTTKTISLVMCDEDGQKVLAGVLLKIRDGNFIVTSDVNPVIAEEMGINLTDTGIVIQCEENYD